MKKIFRRLKLLTSSIPNITMGLIFEPRLHPWKMVIECLYLTANSFQNRSSYYLKKYFIVTESVGGDWVVNFSNFKFIIPKERTKDEHYIYTLLVLYYDIIYPQKVKYPIEILLNEGPYENKSVIISKNDTVLDIGANVGIFSLYSASKAPEGKIIAFEPIQELVHQIKNVAQINDFKNIDIVDCAVGDNDGSISLMYSSDNFGGASKVLESGEQTEVKMVTIDSFVKTASLENVGFIKMDIEGMEPEALRGAKETLRKMKPRLAICTYHDPSHPKLIEELILVANSKYKIKHSSHKVFAW